LQKETIPSGVEGHFANTSNNTFFKGWQGSNLALLEQICLEPG
jgi:hypothetical protein